VNFPQRDFAANQMEWLIFNLRWLIIAAIAASLFIGPNPTKPGDADFALLVTLVVFNALIALLEFFNFWKPALIVAALVVDGLLGAALFVTTGALRGPLLWIGLLPALTAALRYRWLSALLVTVLFHVALVVAVFIFFPRWGTAQLLQIGLAAVTVLAGTVVARLIAGRLRRHLYEYYGDPAANARRAQNLRKRAQAIYDMASMVSATQDYERVLDAALNFGAMGAEGQATPHSKMVAAALMFDGEELKVRAGWRLPPADNRVVCLAREGILAQVARIGDPMSLNEPDRDPELQQFVGFRNCRSLLALPLRVGLETHGAVLYGHTEPDFFDDDQRAFFTAMVNQAIIALQNAQLYKSLRAEKERLLQVQEEANKKLARDLHDGPTQAVAALAMRANFTRRLMERDGKAASEELFKMEDLARRTTKEIRHMLFTLRPLVLESQGLSAALKQLAEKMGDTHGQNVVVEADASLEDRLEKNQQTVLFYITEEAVNNARKHAQAEHIWVRLKANHDTLILDIQDDGVGFNVGEVNDGYDRRGSLGMVNMRERAEMLSGTVKIDSAEGKGTRITVLVPLNEN